MTNVAGVIANEMVSDTANDVSRNTASDFCLASNIVLLLTFQ